MPENLLLLHHHQPRLLFHPSRLRGSVRVKESTSSHKLRPQAHSVVFAHLLVKELNTKLMEEFNEDPDDADLDKLISDPSRVTRMPRIQCNSPSNFISYSASRRSTTHSLNRLPVLASTVSST